MSNISERIASGAFWQIGSQLLLQVVQFCVTMVLARLLAPAEFGIVAMVMVVRGILNVFLNTGFNQALIQRKDVSQEHVDTAFSVNFVVGLSLFCSCWYFAPQVANYFNQEVLTPLIRVSGSGFVLGPLFAVHQALIVRELKFATLTKINISIGLTTHIVTLVLAWGGWGGMSLVAGGVFSNLIAIPIYRTVCKQRILFSPTLSSLREMFSFSGWLYVTSFINYFSRNLDNLLIGKYIGASALGYYNLSYNLMMIPVENVSYPLKDVLFSNYSRVSEDINKIKTIVYKNIKYISLVVFPAMSGLAFVSDCFIPIFYGDNWVNSIPVIKILSFVGAMQSLYIPVSSIILARGFSSLIFKVQLFALFIYSIAFFIGLPWGILGVSFSYALGNIVVITIVFIVACRVIPLSGIKIVSSLLPALFGSACMYALLFLFSEIPLLQSYSDWKQLLFNVIFGVIIYMICVRFFAPDEWNDTVSIVRTKLRGV